MEQFATMVRHLLKAIDFPAELASLAARHADTFAGFQVAEHLRLINTLPDGLERICLAVLYYEMAKRSRRVVLEVWTHFVIRNRETEVVQAADFEAFSETAVGQLPHYVAEDDLLDCATRDVLASPSKRLRLELLLHAHDTLTAYLNVIRETRLRISQLLLPTITGLQENDRAHAESKARVADLVPEVVAQVDAANFSFETISSDLLVTADGLRAYLEHEAATEADALAIATQFDKSNLEGRIRLLAQSGENIQAWSFLQGNRSRVILSQLTAFADEASPITERETAHEEARVGNTIASRDWLQLFRSPTDDPLDQFRHWLAHDGAAASRIDRQVLTGPEQSYARLRSLLRCETDGEGHTAIVEFVTTDVES
jgi:hypothetical protein